MEGKIPFDILLEGTDPDLAHFEMYFTGLKKVDTNQWIISINYVAG